MPDQDQVLANEEAPEQAGAAEAAEEEQSEVQAAPELSSTIDAQEVEELVAERERNEYLKERHKQVIDDLKVSTSSSRPQLVIGFALLAILVVMLLISRLMA